MKAIQFDQYGEPTQVLTLRETSIPEPGTEEVLVLEGFPSFMSSQAQTGGRPNTLLSQMVLPAGKCR
ncbi:hypothetical protein KDW_61250 [Dictyobacter vulcani]|uniref:Uncharacterized protein n=1 Tax=Dictyobacter vulcani TaxID=2607529 RepID=A0A5J4KWV5_9CHLR|nr:hypothetical protein [Dictyobacter vulcani]GER91963.1 hypothetical protein KDW_61250 [Dictyobacter vulcani]